MPMRNYRDQEAKNETIFREMNEWTEEPRDGRIATELKESWLLCECSESACTEPISLSRQEYEFIRAEPVRFAVALNHENPEIERVLFENSRFATVEKMLRAGSNMARSTDPRR
jgi:hypothetical protein